MKSYVHHLERLAAGPWPETPREPDFRSREWLPESRDALMLDVGCGLGKRMAELHHWGYHRLVGVDVNPDVVAAARTRLPEDVELVCAGATEFLAAGARKYDRVVIAHVLEHMNVEEAVAMLGAVRASLTADGRVVVEVPNMTCLTAAHMFHSDVTHRQGYTEYSLTQVFEESGFGDVCLICPRPPLELQRWRPWRPFMGTTIGWRTNVLLHRLAYRITDMGPRARCFCPHLLMTASPAKES